MLLWEAVVRMERVNMILLAHFLARGKVLNTDVLLQLKENILALM